MGKAAVITVFTMVLALFGSGSSYATPVRETSDKAGARPVFSRVASAPQLVAQAVTELKTAGIPHRTVKSAGGLKTTFRFEQGLSVTFVEPAASPSASAFIGGGWDWGGPYVLFNKYDVDLIFNGSAYALTVGICLLPGVGWAACTAVGAITTAVTHTINANTGIPCRNSQMKIYVSGRFGGCV